MAVLLDSAEELEIGRQILFENFSNNAKEITAATLKQRYQNHDFSNRLVFGLKSINSDGKESLVAVAVCMPRKVEYGQTLEVIWFSTSSKFQKHGYGSELLQDILAYAAENKCKAVLCTSTNRAASWWLSRCQDMNVNLCKTILRNDGRVNLHDVSFTDNPAENAIYLEIIENMKAEMSLKIESFPTTRLFEKLYSEKLMRNKRGKLLKGQTFSGAPYRYCTNKSNHIWFLLCNSLVEKLS